MQPYGELLTVTVVATWEHGIRLRNITKVQSLKSQTKGFDFMTDQKEDYQYHGELIHGDCMEDDKGFLLNCARCGEMFMAENDDEYLCEACQEMED